METRSYRALAEIDKGGDIYLPGDTLELSGREAAQLLEVNAVEDAEEDADGTSRQALLADAVGELSGDDFTSSGKPKVSSLERVTGLEGITAAERDKAIASRQG